MSPEVFGKAFDFLAKVFRLERGTEGGRVNLGVMVVLIVAIAFMYASSRISSILEAVFGGDSTDFPLVAVVLILAGLLIFCVSVLIASEFIRERQGGSG